MYAEYHLQVLRGFKWHQVRKELQQKHQRFLTVCMVATASTERYLKSQRRTMQGRKINLKGIKNH